MSERKPITVTEGRVKKGGHNPPNTSAARPAPPKGSGGSNDKSRYANAVDAWLDDKGKRTLNTSILDEPKNRAYLENRIRLAVNAGHDIVMQAIRETLGDEAAKQVENHLSEVQRSRP